ncbi:MULTISPECIES: winged helix-turn-helix transcriptional regulator [unclassified Streptomyces]|uniref:winged helix-turn-helix transcriptional regulator n=1 Tax=unclassified Streptomyces TaxID=2593676 RepID=UPI00202F701B|nr:MULTISPECIES: winged helix-turn-helix transcriptional regulator [unclassified Streptomyces]MCM1968662.1 winged helix-turn-helix transcriptional regulator [Streptomyces sp. G1]MCX5125014.1 winged helix-turn-helix transcriptional regulator [Streptomyces sp. NBC_00347]MCX5299167.1 winged helix-turn-helix transcriptional regulator [Streptomyces sp. NBC_00193]
MAQRTHLDDADCSIAQALDVVGDWWTLLIVRDAARGVHRFDDFQRELGMSRKVLTERLKLLVEAGVLTREPYQDRPVRYAYRLTPRGRGLLPVLVALQDWGDTWILGEGEMTATTHEASREAVRVHALRGTRLPELTLPDRFGELRDPVADTPFTVLYCFPGAFARSESYPPGWAGIPGARGCTLESCTYRDQLAEFTAAGATVHGVSTQRPDEQREFAEAEGLRFPLLSDAELGLVTALRLPTFRAGGISRLKRLTLVVDRDRTVREVFYPVQDIEASVAAALAAVRGA